MKEFRVEIPNKPGQLARLGQALGMRGVGIKAVASVGTSNPAVFAFVTDNDSLTQTALKELNLAYEEVEVLTAKFTDHAGGLGRFAQQLGDEMINIDSIYLLHRIHHEVEIGFTVDDVTKAKEILGLESQPS